MKRSRPDKSKQFHLFLLNSLLFIKDLLDSNLSSPRRVAVPVLIRNGRPCHQQRFSLASTSASTAVSNQHIHGQSTSNGNSSLVASSTSSSCKNDTSPNILFNDRQHMKYDNMELFQQFLLSQWALSKKLFFPTTI